MLALLQTERWRWCALVTATVSAIYLLGLSSFGFWDPQELDVVVAARGEAPVGEAPFAVWTARLGFDLLGVNELGGRFFFALSGIATALLVFAWVSQLATARVAAVSALLTATAPLVVLASRQLTPAIGGALGQIAMIAGGTAILRPGTSRRWVPIVGALLGLAGAAIAYAAAGIIVGVAVPIASIAVAASAIGRFRAAALAALLAGAAVGLGLAKVASLGTAWPTPPREVLWDRALEPMLYGMFPWIALAPVALASALTKTEIRARFAAWLAFAWSAGALTAGAVSELAFGPSFFFAVPALAYAVSAWLDDVGTERTAPSPGAVVLALCVVGLLARDLYAFPARLVWLHFPAGGAGAPQVGGLRLLAVAGMFAAALVAGVHLRGRARTASVVTLVASAVGFGLVLSLAWTNAVSRDRSPRELFECYRAARQHEPLILLRVSERIAALYAPDGKRARSERDVIGHLTSGDRRAFAMIPQGASCKVLQDVRKRGGALHTLAANQTFALVSNRRRDGDPRGPGLEQYFSSEPPIPQWPLDVVLEDGVAIVGIDLPARVGRGKAFRVTLYYHVHARPRRKWKVFAHFDGAGVRFQGDHWPIQDRCATQQWNPGDYVTDSFTVKAGSMLQPGGTYRLWAGFFFGGHGKWTNMRVRSGEADNADRALVGTIAVQ